VITAWYTLPTAADGKFADIAIGCAGLLVALVGVPALSEEQALVIAIKVIRMITSTIENSADGRLVDEAREVRD
jgi:hypothetical protein